MKRLITISAVAATACITLSAALIINKNNHNFVDTKAGENDYTITFAYGGNGTARTTKTNSLMTLESRYVSDWDFDVDEGGGNEFFACAKSETNEFLGNPNSPFQKISAFTVIFETPIAVQSEDHSISVSLKTGETLDWSATARVNFEQIESGHRYDLFDAKADYFYTSSSDEFRYFVLQDYLCSVKISSIVIEYTCA